jgi:hypothetical protein
VGTEKKLDIKEKAESQLNVFEKIVNKIPGFKGYFKRELRRDSDKLQRDYIAEKLANVKNKLNLIIKEVAKEKRLDLLSDYDEMMRGLEKIINEVRYADRGYSGFFDLMKIKEEQLDEVYHFDAQILENVTELVQKFEILNADPLNKNEVRLLKINLDKIEAEFKSRMEILCGWK